MVTKNSLGKILSGLREFENPEFKLEQYITPSEIASDFLWFCYMQGDIKNKVIADLGCGTGMLGIGALLLGAKKVYFIDKSAKALEIAKKNFNSLKLAKNSAVFLCQDVKNFNNNVDTVIENPPFGVKNEHADKGFLEQAVKISDKIYSFHKIESEEFIKKFSKDNGFDSKIIFIFNFPLKLSMKYHTKEVKKIRVGVWKLERK